ncbi:MAG: hypothetical protein HGA55_06890 [Methanoregulaceae archaeon]|nr:hypothetical protein [Methanoregulaceae archaeon]
MSFVKYLGLLCLGCLMVGAASAFSTFDGAVSPAFSNRVESGNSMVMATASLSTSLGDTFVQGSGTGVNVFNKVDISSYASDLPSKGSVSAFIKGKTLEGGRGSSQISQRAESPKDLY